MMLTLSHGKADVKHGFRQVISRKYARIKFDSSKGNKGSHISQWLPAT